MHSSQNNLNNSYTEKEAKLHLQVTHCLQFFNLIKQKTNYIVTEVNTVWKGFAKTFQHAMKIVNYEKKEMMPLTDEETKSYEKQKVCHICKKEFSTDKSDKMNLNYTAKSEIIVITPENLEELFIVFAI